jgi:Icc-related predicted phosphoesterase
VTRIWTFSDLHQEFVRDSEHGSNPLTAFDPLAHAPEDFDVVVVPGDVDVPLTGSLTWLAERFPGVPVVYTPGNHDFFNEANSPNQYTMLEQQDAGRELADKLGIHLLMNDTVELAGSRFIGATLWTDFASVGVGSTTAKMKEAEGRFGMNDYRRIKRESSVHPGKKKRLRPRDTMDAHRASREYIESQLAIPFDGPSVLVSHHAPHPLSINNRYSTLAFCYASNLSLMLEADDAPELCLHGHIHKKLSYTVGKTRVVSNPRGYQFLEAERQNGFDPSLVVEVEQRQPSFTVQQAARDYDDMGPY